MLKRRELLGTGAAAGATLALGGGLGLSASEAQAQVIPPLSALDATSLAIVRVFVPIVLGNGALPTETTARQASVNLIAQRAGEIVSNYPLVNQGVIQSVFDGLKAGPEKFLGAPAGTPWEAIPAANLTGLLNALRVSTDFKQRGIFSTLMGLIPNAHYSNPINWPAINYPGPPKFA